MPVKWEAVFGTESGMRVGLLGEYQSREEAHRRADQFDQLNESPALHAWVECVPAED